MIDRIVELSIRRRGLTIALGVAIAAWGAWSLGRIPVDAIPDLSETQVIVFTAWPGAGPQEIDDQITFPLSLGLQGIDGVRSVRGASEVGFSMIHLIFDDHVEIEAARRAVTERLAGVREDLPESVTPSLAPDSPATGQIFWYTVEGQGYDLGRLRTIQDWHVRHQLASVPGVAEVASVGGFSVELHVEVDPLALARQGVTLAQVAVAVQASNTAGGPGFVHQGGTEYVVRTSGALGADPTEATREFSAARAIRDLENVVVPRAGKPAVRLSDLAHVSLGPGPRRGVFEKDGSEAVGGVVSLRHGANTLEVTRAILHKIEDLQPSMPPGVSIVPGYDRIDLIRGAARTVSLTLVEAIVTSTVCILLVLLHFRTSLVIALTLPTVVLSCFGLIWLGNTLGWTAIQTNIMSLAGLAISVGVLVDASIVMAENVMHELRRHFGDRPVQGDVRPIVLAACRTVARPMFFSVLIMLLSFLPVFALGGIEGKMFRPLAFTKCFALASSAALSLTLVPALCTVLIRGRLRSEQQSWLLRSCVEVYRPVLAYLLERPAPLVWVLGVTGLLGAAALGSRPVFLATLLLALCASVWLTRSAAAKLLVLASLVTVALLAERWITPLGSEFMVPLDEGTVMDMPITIPRVSLAQGADDLTARDMVLCRFPEVLMVMGKIGRADTPNDPAPLDMIETMVSFRRREHWVRRKLPAAKMQSLASAAWSELVARGIVDEVADAQRGPLLDEVSEAAHFRFDAQMREYVYHRHQELARRLGRQLLGHLIDAVAAGMLADRTLAQPLSLAQRTELADNAPTDVLRRLGQMPQRSDVAVVVQAMQKRLGRPTTAVDSERETASTEERAPSTLELLGWRSPTLVERAMIAVQRTYDEAWRLHVYELDGELPSRAEGTAANLLLEEFLARRAIVDPATAAAWAKVQAFRSAPPRRSSAAAHHHTVSLPAIDPVPRVDALARDLTERWDGEIVLWRSDRQELVGFGGELDRAVQMPGWANVWTMPIQNRVDMLATGVSSEVGVRVLGRRLEDVVSSSEQVAAALRGVPGAADVVADPVRGKGYLDIHLDRERAASLGAAAQDVQIVIETALSGHVATHVRSGRERHAVRLTLPRMWRDDEDALARLPVPVAPALTSAGTGASPQLATLGDVASLQRTEGPASIKSENGLLRNYVRLNVRDRSAIDFVAEAQRIVTQRVSLPPGVYLEWTGQFEHQARARRTLLVVVPAVIAVVFGILWWTYRDLADALLMVLALPGALSGGLIAQWWLGYKFSVTVWVGYIACLGMAASTGIIMLVYLREAVERAGGLQKLSLDGLKQAVMDGAVHRLRPKLLTEATTIIGLAPLLWATGVGAEVIRPMAAPVLGGLLVADEVIDLFLPVMFFWVRRRRWRKLHPEEQLPGLPRSMRSTDPVPSNSLTAASVETR
ncbi:MAG: efflux RND transporter permease subunit [Pirellulales bacterium]